MLSTDELRDILWYIVKNYSKVSLYIDVMHVNSIMFLVGASKHIGLIQYVCIRKKQCEMFLGAILLMITEYRARGVFGVISIGANKAFNSVKSILKDKLYQIALTMCNAIWHIEVIERMIRFVKERIRVVWLAMTYTTIPKRFTIEMVYCVVIPVNSLPHK